MYIKAVGKNIKWVRVEGAFQFRRRKLRLKNEDGEENQEEGLNPKKQR